MLPRLLLLPTRLITLILCLHVKDRFFPTNVACGLQGGATHVDIACDPELVKLAISLTSLPVKPYSSEQLFWSFSYEFYIQMKLISHFLDTYSDFVS